MQHSITHAIGKRSIYTVRHAYTQMSHSTIFMFCVAQHQLVVALTTLHCPGNQKHRLAWAISLILFWSQIGMLVRSNTCAAITVRLW